jgi:hypothetical protein
LKERFELEMDSFIAGRSLEGRRSRWTTSVAAGLILSIAIAPAVVAAENNAGSMAAGMGIGTAAAVSSLIYGPVKIGYALCGIVVGGLAWVFSGGDGEVAKTVMTPAIYGDYVVSPAVLRGDDPLEFYGRAPGYESSYTADVSSAPPTTPPSDW